MHINEVSFMYSWEDPLEEEMATHSSIFAWRIPWTEEPGGLQCMGSQKVRHNWVTDTILPKLLGVVVLNWMQGLLTMSGDSFGCHTEGNVIDI